MSIKYQKIENKRVWFTSDLHGFHKNIAKGTSKWSSGYRDFENEVIMTEYICNQINKYVSKDDMLIHLGDWSFGGIENIFNLREMVNCKHIINVTGNHDHLIREGKTFITTEEKWLSYKNRYWTTDAFEDKLELEVPFKHQENLYINYEGYNIHMSHFPYAIWDGKHKGHLHLHGHTHGEYQGDENSLDVGIDNAYKLFGEYKPFSFDEIKNILKL